MGFDVTIHPVSLTDIDTFVFDVARDPQLARDRASRLTVDETRQKQLMSLYSQFPGWIEDQSDLPSTFGITCAAIAGFRRPFWYVRGFSLTWTPDSAHYFTPLALLSRDLFSKPPSGTTNRLDEGGSTSGIILPEHVGQVRTLAETHLRSRLNQQDQADILRSVHLTLTYAEQNKLAVIEASDLVVPLANQCFTESTNMKAAFLGNL